MCPALAAVTRPTSGSGGNIDDRKSFQVIWEERGQKPLFQRDESVGTRVIVLREALISLSRRENSHTLSTLGLRGRRIFCAASSSKGQAYTPSLYRHQLSALQRRARPARNARILDGRPAARQYSLEGIDQPFRPARQPGQRRVLTHGEVIPTRRRPFFRSLRKHDLPVDLAVHAVRMRGGRVVLHDDLGFRVDAFELAG